MNMDACWVYDEVTKVTYPGFTSREEAVAFAKRTGGRLTVRCGDAAR